MNQKLKLMILATLTALTLTSCACSNGLTDTPTPVPVPSAAATPIPMPTQTPTQPPAESILPDESLPAPSPSAEPGGTQGPTMMGIDVTKLITELEKLSEVDTAQVVASQGRALVGLSFDAQYQGTLTERIEEMVIGAVTSVEEMLTDIAVTADPTLVTEIRTLSSQIKDGEMDETQQKQFDELYRRIKPDASEEPAVK